MVALAEEPVTLDLPAPFAPITVVAHLDLDTGIARFDVRGRRAAGAFLFVPHTTIEEALPTDVWVAFGAGRHHADPPTVNGVPLGYGAMLHPHALPDGVPRRRDLNLRRPDTTWYRRTEFPDRAGAYATAIIGALLRHWLDHPRHHELVVAAARRDANRRIAELCRTRIEPAREQIVELTASVHAATRVIEELRALCPDLQVPPGTRLLHATTGGEG